MSPGSIIMKFLLKNQGSATISDLYAALFMDWDIGDYANNHGSSEPGRNLTWMYFSTPYLGVAILDPPRSIPARNLALINHDGNKGLPDSIQIKFMDGTIQNPASTHAYDWSTCNSARPFTLAPGEAQVVAFAILGGDNLTDLKANAGIAYNRYWNWHGVEEAQSSVMVSGLKVYPLVSRGRAHTLAYSFVEIDSS